MEIFNNNSLFMLILNKKFMQNSIKERLIMFLKYKRIGQNKFENMVGLSSGYISHMKESTIIRVDQLESIKKGFPDLNDRWLITGEGDMLLPEETFANKEDAMFAGSDLYKQMKKRIDELQSKMSIGGDNITIGDQAKGSFQIKNVGECKLCAEKERLIASLEEQIRAKDELIEALRK